MSNDQGNTLCPWRQDAKPQPRFPPGTIPGHALHERGIKTTKRQDPLVSRQERRVAVVLLTNRLSTARKPDVVPSTGVR